MFYRHIHLGHVVRVTAWPERGDIFAGIVVESDDEQRIELDTYSTVWIKSTFKPTARVESPALMSPNVYETLRVALGVDLEPLATLAQRVQERATRAGRALAMLEAWAAE